MKIRSRLLDVLGSSVLSLAVIACSDDGGDETTGDGGADAGVDASGGTGGEADSSVAPDDTSTDAGGSGSDSGEQTVDVTLTHSDDSTDAGSADAADAAPLDATAATADTSNEDSGASDTTQDTVSTDESDAGDASAEETTGTSAPTDTTTTSVTESDPPDAADETTTQTDESDTTVTEDTTTESSIEETLTNDTVVVTEEVDASVDGGAETTTAATSSATTNAPTSDIQTSDVTTGASEEYWIQSIWSGYVFPFGAGQVTLDNGTVCVSGNEVGTVGLLYNVNQVENGEPMAFAPDGNDAGIDLNIVSEMGGQVRFSAGGTEYCAQAVEGETFYFWFWDRFSDCATGTIEYDGQTPFEAIAIVLSATGEYELCVDKFNVGELPEGGVFPVDASVSFDASLPDPT